MIIICSSCKKRFEINENLIPDKGRLLKCGSCGETWFFNKSDQINLDSSDIKLNEEDEIIDKHPKTPKKIRDIKKSASNIPDNKGTELVRYKPKSNFTVGKLLGYLIVLIISFVAVIIILDTFKSSLSNYFPNLELILYNLFETLRDLILFAKDLN